MRTNRSYRSKDKKQASRFQSFSCSNWRPNDAKYVLSDVVKDKAMTNSQ